MPRSGLLPTFPPLHDHDGDDEFGGDRTSAIRPHRATAQPGARRGCGSATTRADARRSQRRRRGSATRADRRCTGQRHAGEPAAAAGASQKKAPCSFIDGRTGACQRLPAFSLALSGSLSCRPPWAASGCMFAAAPSAATPRRAGVSGIIGVVWFEIDGTTSPLEMH